MKIPGLGSPLKGQDYGNGLLNVVIAVALLSLIIGVIAPVLTLKKLYLVSNTFSMVSGISGLWRGGQWPLAIVIFFFTIAVPFGKLVLLFVVVNRQTTPRGVERIVHLLSRLGRWSMLDVFVVAVLVASVKLGALASIEVHYGLYLFGFAVLLTMVAMHKVQHRLESPEASPDSQVDMNRS